MAPSHGIVDHYVKPSKLQMSHPCKPGRRWRLRNQRSSADQIDLHTGPRTYMIQIGPCTPRTRSVEVAVRHTTNPGSQHLLSPSCSPTASASVVAHTALGVTSPGLVPGENTSSSARYSSSKQLS